MGMFKEIWVASLPSKEDNIYEEYEDSVNRVLQAVDKQLKVGFTKYDEWHDWMRYAAMKIPRINKIKIDPNDHTMHIQEHRKASMAIDEIDYDEWEQLELDLSEWANNSPVFPPQIDLELPELPKEEKKDDCKKDIYCNCLFPKVRKVAMIFSSYDFCDSCKKEKK